MCYAASKIAEAEARGDVAAVRYWVRIRDLIDQAPPLTSEQKATLRTLLRPVPAAASTPLRTAA